MTSSLLVAPLAEPEEATALKMMDPELHYLLEARKIDSDIIAMISYNGLEDMITFHKWDDSADKVRAAIIKDLKLDPDTSPKHRAMVARIVAAWEAAGKRITARDAEEAEQRTAGSMMPKTVSKSVYLEITRSFAKVHRELPDKEQPAKTLVEKRFEQTEEGELVAETLKELVTKAEESEDAFGGCSISSDGTPKLKRGRAESTVPSKPEELRSKLKVLATLWEYVRLKFPKKPMVKSYELSLWSDYADWLLGDEVYDSVINANGGDLKYRPAWTTVLELDFQVRKRAYKMINEEGISLRLALTGAMQHEPTIRKYFMVPTSMAAGAAAAVATLGHVPPPPAPHKVPRQDHQADRPVDGAADQGVAVGNYKGGKGGKGGKGAAREPQTPPKTKAWKKGRNNLTPDGRLKCFKYQRDKCKEKNCAKVHVCLVCNNDHPMIRCDRKPK